MSEGNVIAFNAEGVRVDSPVDRVSVRFNSIFDNTPVDCSVGHGLGIDLVPTFGVTANDSGDSDTGANQLQNFPGVTSATKLSSGAVQVAGGISSTPATVFLIDLYSSPTCDTSGNGEGKTWLKTVTVTTNSSGVGLFGTQVSATVPVGHFITATATTSSTGRTSEFSACKQVVTP